MPSDPAAAERASFLYAQARERAARGDASGALAAAASAQALAGARSAAPLPTLAPQIQPGGAAGALVPPSLAASAGLPETGLLPAGLLAARNEIELAERIGHAPLTEAKAHYRSALDAYLSGNAARSRVEAKASFDLAAEVISKAK